MTKHLLTNEATSGKLLDSFYRELVARKEKVLIRNLELSTTSHLSEKGEGLETELIINHAYFGFAIEIQM